MKYCRLFVKHTLRIVTYVSTDETTVMYGCVRLTLSTNHLQHFKEG